MQKNDKCWIELLLLDKNKWNYLTVSKNSTPAHFKNMINKMCLQIIDILYTRVNWIWH